MLAMLFPVLIVHISFANCGQTAADSDFVTIDSLWEPAIALFNGTIADSPRHTV